jgi:nitrile hydratase
MYSKRPCECRARTPEVDHWAQARSYRARTVRDPRGVLKEFGTVLPDDVAIIVHDSNAETR